MPAERVKRWSMVSRNVGRERKERKWARKAFCSRALVGEEKVEVRGENRKRGGKGKGPLAPLVNTYRYQAPPIVNSSYPAVPLGGSFIRGPFQPFRYAGSPIGSSLQTQ